MYNGYFALFQSPNLADGLNCAVNAPVRLVQAVAFAIQNLQSPNLNATTIELQCTIINAGDWAEQILLFVLNTLADFVDLIPITMMSSPQAEQIYGIMGIKPVQKRQSMTAATVHNLELAQLIMAIRDPYVIQQAQFSNLSDAIGFGYIIRLFSTPWSQVITQPAAAWLSFVNGTWDLCTSTRGSNLTCHSPIDYRGLSML